MKEIWTGIQIVFSAIGSFFVWVFGGADGLLYALIAFVCADYIMGVLKGFYQKKLSSQVGARGIVKKVAMFLIVGIASLADTYLLHDSGALRLAVILFYCSNEGISILENAVDIGIKVPDKLRKALAQLRKNHDNNEEDSV